MQRAARRDKNEPALIIVAERLGATVAKINQEGLPDLLIGFTHLITGTKINLLVEVKSKSGKLTPAQIQFFNTWAGQRVVIREPEEMFVYLWREMGWSAFLMQLCK
jgi:hypothetical protein